MPTGTGTSAPSLRGCGEDTPGVAIPWVRRDALALLAPSVRFGEDRGFFSRLQIHFSIGQAF